MTQKVRLKTLCKNLRLIAKGSDTTWNYMELDVGEVSAWGPLLERIMPYTLTLHGSSGFEWKVVFWWGFDGEHTDATPVDLFAAVTGDGPLVQIPYDYSSSSKLAPQMTYGIAFRSSAGSSAPVSPTDGHFFFCGDRLHMAFTQPSALSDQLTFIGHARAARDLIDVLVGTVIDGDPLAAVAAPLVNQMVIQFTYDTCNLVDAFALSPDAETLDLDGGVAVLSVHDPWMRAGTSFGKNTLYFASSALGGLVYTSASQLVLCRSDSAGAASEVGGSAAAAGLGWTGH